MKENFSGKGFWRQNKLQIQMADHSEVTKFTQCLKMYIKAEFRGSPLDTNILMFIQSFLTSTYWAALEHRGVRTNNPDAIIAGRQESCSWQKNGSVEGEEEWASY